MLVVDVMMAGCEARITPKGDTEEALCQRCQGESVDAVLIAAAMQAVEETEIGHAIGQAHGNPVPEEGPAAAGGDRRKEREPDTDVASWTDCEAAVMPPPEELVFRCEDCMQQAP